MAARLEILIKCTSELAETLDDSRRATGRAQISDVVRDGMELYDLVIQHSKSGRRIFIGHSPETAAEVKLDHLQLASAWRYLDAIEIIVGPPVKRKITRTTAKDVQRDTRRMKRVGFTILGTCLLLLALLVVLRL
jgi:hypothetical protein